MRFLRRVERAGARSAADGGPLAGEEGPRGLRSPARTRPPGPVVVLLATTLAAVAATGAGPAAGAGPERG
ncbi:SWIM zinc finger family protein, partial [Streptomyces diastaticus]